MASPTFTRANTGKGPTTAGVVQTTIVPTYTAAAAGGVLLAVVFASQTNSGITCSGTANWTLISSISMGATTFGDTLYAYFFQNTAVDASTSATFTFSLACTPFAIVYEFNSTAGLDSTKIFSATSPSTNVSSIGTGSGTAQETNDYQLIGGINNDSIVSASAVTGFTQDYATGDHGDSGSSFGASITTYHANAVNSSTTVGSNTITWTGLSGPAFGFTLLMRPTVSGTAILPNYEAGTAHYTGGMAA